MFSASYFKHVIDYIDLNLKNRQSHLPQKIIDPSPKRGQGSFPLHLSLFTSWSKQQPRRKIEQGYHQYQ